jgi:hypothetical protein
MPLILTFIALDTRLSLYFNSAKHSLSPPLFSLLIGINQLLELMESETMVYKGRMIVDERRRGEEFNLLG